MLDTLHRLFYDMKAQGLEPSHWIIGVAIMPDILQLRTPWGEWVAQPQMAIHKGPSIFGLPWEIDYKNPTRLELAPSPFGGRYTYDRDGSPVMVRETAEADRLLRELFS